MSTERTKKERETVRGDKFEVAGLVKYSVPVILSFPMKKVLVVGSLDLYTVKARNMLSLPDVVTLTTASAEEAIQMHRAEKVDLIITDLELGGMGGDDICDIVRRDETLKKVSIIIICVNKKSALKRCEACGANACLTKPVDLQALFQKVNDLLSISRRESLRILIRVSVQGKSRDGYFFSTSRNISTTGILLETDKVIAKGDRVTCSFFLKSTQITVNGETVRVERRTGDLNQYGVKFIDLSPEAKVLIEDFIRRSQTR